MLQEFLENMRKSCMDSTEINEKVTRLISNLKKVKSLKLIMTIIDEISDVKVGILGVQFQLDALNYCMEVLI